MNRQFIEYWILHPFWGVVDYLTFFLLRLFSIRQVSRIGALVGSLAKNRYRQAREDTEANLRLLKPDYTVEKRNAVANRMWQNIARSLTEMAVLDRFDLDRDVAENHLEVLQQLGKDKPVVFLFPHLGNWELLALSVIRQGFRLNVMFEQVPNRFQRRLLTSSRRRIGYELISPDYQGTRQVFRALAAGQSIGLAMDEFKRSKVVAPVFHGNIAENSNIHNGISLARRFHAPIVMGYCKRLDNTQFEISYLLPINLDDPEYQNQLDGDIAAIINEQCRQWVLANLDQWYMLHRARIR